MAIIPITVEEEYRKNAGKLNSQDIQVLKEWLKKQPHLPKIKDLDLILLFHSSDYNLEKTKILIEKYYTIRTHCPEFFNNRQIEHQNLRQILDVVLYGIVPTMTPEGYKIMVCNLVVSDPEHFSFIDGLKMFCMVCDLWLQEEGTSNGHIIICDMSGTMFGHLSKLGLMPMKRIMYYLQEALPFKLKGIHFVNIVPYMDKIFALMRPFLKKELADLLFVHNKLEDIYKYVPKEILPRNLGGNSFSYKEMQDRTLEKIVQNSDWFEYDEKFNRVDESKRLDKSSNPMETDLFGVEGSFRQLVID